MSLFKRFQNIIREMIGNNDGAGIADIDISEQFKRKGEGEDEKAEKLNAAFLIRYAGEKHPFSSEAWEYIEECSGDPEWESIISFLGEGMALMGDELERSYHAHNDFRDSFEELYSGIASEKGKSRGEISAGKIRELFFPEGGLDPGKREEEISALRNKRRVILTEPNREIIRKPETEILFTSNALLTIPPTSADIDEIDIHPGIKEKLKKITPGKQLYWYDHPVQIGVVPEQNELIYGLENFDRALAFEEEAGTKERETKVDFLLSVSVTHGGLHEISREYIEHELKKKSSIKKLNLYIFTETDTRDLIEEVLLPAAEKYLPGRDTDVLHEIFGVDGRYGRHYTFLKAVAALWQVLIKPEIRGTFKIDLDQVFPQEELLEKTGNTAFGHFRSELWGASGKDYKGNTVHLGLIAGALVNEKDMGKSLYHPDVTFPESDEKRDALVFHSKLPQALSTAAEMGTRYGVDPDMDGRKSCIQRIHVTGGTTGVLVESLRSYRPFTPSFIGRAEDQAYLLSVLFSERKGGYLRYLHRDGLIMRHDKEVFASESVKAAKTGKMIGDYERIVLFSYYADSLPWDIDRIKEAVDPFTGCFISRIPWTVVILRLMLKTASLFENERNSKDAAALLKLGSRRLGNLQRQFKEGKESIVPILERERRGWDLYYDILDILEEKLASGDEFACSLRERAGEIIGNCRLDV